MTSASHEPCERPKGRPLGILDIVDLPRTAYHYLPPKKWQVALTLAGVIVTAILWGLL